MMRQRKRGGLHHTAGTAVVMVAPHCACTMLVPLVRCEGAAGVLPAACTRAELPGTWRVARNTAHNWASMQPRPAPPRPTHRPTPRHCRAPPCTGPGAVRAQRPAAHAGAQRAGQAGASAVAGVQVGVWGGLGGARLAAGCRALLGCDVQAAAIACCVPCASGSGLQVHPA